MEYIAVVTVILLVLTKGLTALMEHKSNKPEPTFAGEFDVMNLYRLKPKTTFATDVTVTVCLGIIFGAVLMMVLWIF